ncbi:hypothetical protein DFH06DRAFT_1411136 [Mycena polygramma]|nr:hypothetical protein DFH06DRAFT_1411136 [Mycena polygramma]
MPILAAVRTRCQGVASAIDKAYGPSRVQGLTTDEIPIPGSNVYIHPIRNQFTETGKDIRSNTTLWLGSAGNHKLEADQADTPRDKRAEHRLIHRLVRLGRRWAEESASAAKKSCKERVLGANISRSLHEEEAATAPMAEDQFSERRRGPSQKPHELLSRCMGQWEGERFQRRQCKEWQNMSVTVSQFQMTEKTKNQIILGVHAPNAEDHTKTAFHEVGSKTQNRQN